MGQGTAAVVLWLHVEPGEPVSGSVGLEGHPGVPFSGWIELMARISAVREERELAGDAP